MAPKVPEMMGMPLVEYSATGLLVALRGGAFPPAWINGEACEPFEEAVLGLLVECAPCCSSDRPRRNAASLER